MARTNLFMGCALLLLSLIGLIWVIPSQHKPAVGATDLSPGLMPSLACAVIAILSVVLIARSIMSLRAREMTDESQHEEFQGEVTGLGRRELYNLLIWIGFSLAAIGGFKYVGFLITAPVLVAASMIFAGSRRWLLIAIVSTVAPILIYAVVWYVFSVRLP